MGVHGLWDLLAPVGRRVSVETLAGKRLAIDASIWMVQFMKAMRDENGEMVRNAHILGFFRRICKLLYLRTKPVFVFDGGTPALKRRTVIARRRQRENAQAKIRKTAEKLLLNQFKQIQLNKLAEELQKQKTNKKAKGKKVITGEEVEKLSNPSDFDDKEVITDEAVTTPKISGGNLSYSGCYNQEELDEMLAASLLTEEEGFVAGESSSGAHVHDQEEDADEDEEMILPAMHAKVDPAILAALPPSMQLDLLVQMRERLMAENRSKYQKVKKVPSSFSELQIESYLKTVAFRREIDEVRKSAAGRGIGGVQTSRIASEANREFIFSSSYSGDKNVLTSAGRGSGNNDHISAPMAKSSNDIVDNGTPGKGKTASVSTEVDSQLEALRKGKTALVSNDVEPPLEYENDVETYLDERGRVRLSRVRAMGIRMTRDLQRNLDLMKEIEEESVSTSNIVQTDPSVDPNAVDVSGKASKNSQLVEDSVLDTDELASENIKLEEALLAAGTSLEISFENNGQDELGVDDDDLFASLVAGDPVMGFSVDNSSSQKQDVDNASELEWEEGNNLSNDTEVVSRPCSTDGGVMDEKELEWEEGSLDLIQRDSSYMADCKENVSKGSIEEEADFQEAIRRSLQDVKVQKSENASCAGVQCRSIAQRASENTNAQFLCQEDLTNLEDRLRAESKYVESPYQVRGTAERLDTMSKEGISHAHNSLEIHSASPLGGTFGETEFASEEGFRSSPKLDYPVQGKSALGSSDAETPMSVASAQEKSVHKSKGWLMDTSGCKDDSFASSSNAPLNSDFVSEGWTDDLTPPNSDAAVDGLDRTAVMATTSVANATNEIDFGNEPAGGGFSIHSSTEREQPFGNFDYLGGKEEQRKVLNERVEEEMLMLGKEQFDLGNEQKKLERNAESVSSEMFAEAQELLQMFGLPYIIAPMEAEAQCAYLELIGLVDGVVTDDSDAFLFGSCSVYKNIFDNRKYVETYFMKDIENELGINREKLIRMALLLGSDYTEGISGIGIVNAIEVVNAFPEEDGLRKFREWIESPDPSILGKFEKQAGGEPRKRGSKVGDDDKQVGDSSSAGNIAGSSDESQRVKQTFMDKHRNVSKNWHFSASFPSDAVISAYASPQVDKAKESFSWGKPDLLVLRKLCWEKFGWSAQKANELLLPVLKEYDKRETQLRLEAFYTFNERFAKIRSKRIKTALKGIAGTKSLPVADESIEDDGGSKKGKRVKQCNAGMDGSIEASKRQKVQDAQLDADNTETSNGNKSKRRRSSAGVGRSQNRSGGQEFGGRAKGRGRGRGKGRGRGTKESDSSHEAGFSSGDGSGAKSGQDLQGVSEEQHQVRRSKRARKEVKYSIDEPKDDSSSDHTTNHSGDENAVKKDEFADLLLTEDLDTVPSQTNNPEIESSSVSTEKDSNLCIDASTSGGTKELQFGSPRQTEDGFPTDIHPSSDYLSMGGGFCLDDDDDEVIVKDPIAEETSSPDMEMTFDPSHGVCSSFVEEDEIDNAATAHQDQSNADDMKKIAGVDISDDTKRSLEKMRNECEHANAEVVEKGAHVDDSSVDSYARSLRALPSLRRKRR